MIGYACINATGTIVLCAVAPSESTKIGLFIAFILMQAIAAVNTAIFLMMSRNIAGQTKKSLVYGTTFMAWGAGNAIAPQLFWASWAPRYLPSLYIHLGIYATFVILCLATRVLLVRRNKAKEAAQAGLSQEVRNLHVSHPRFPPAIVRC
jgi:MFS family permease